MACSPRRFRQQPSTPITRKRSRDSDCDSQCLLSSRSSMQELSSNYRSGPATPSQMVQEYKGVTHHVRTRRYEVRSTAPSGWMC